MRDEGVIYVAGHPLLNRRCTRLWNDRYCVARALHFTHSFTHVDVFWCLATIRGFGPVKRNGRVSCTGNRYPISGDRAPAASYQ